MQFILGSDNVNGQERSVINQVLQILEENGHSVINAGVGPNVVQKISLDTKADAAIQIIGGLDGWTYADFALGIKNGYYKIDRAIFPMCSWIYANRPADHFCKKENIPNWRMVRAHDAGTSLQSMYVGKTISEFCQEYPTINVFGADTPSEMAEMILGLKSASSKKDIQLTSYLDMLKDVLKFWDSEVEAFVRGDKLYVRKIDTVYPEKLKKVAEAYNVVDNAVTVRDYNNNAVNYLVVSYDDAQTGEKNKEIVFKDDNLIKRFGVIKKTVSPFLYVRKNKKTVKEQSSNSNTGQQEDKELETENYDKDAYEKQKITDFIGARDFGVREWRRCKRSNGHIVDVSVVDPESSNTLFECGDWVHVDIPFLNENNAMYVCGTDNSIGLNSDWVNNLKLHDFPPSLSEIEDRDLVKTEQPKENKEKGKNDKSKKAKKNKKKKSSR